MPRTVACMLALSRTGCRVQKAVELFRHGIGVGRDDGVAVKYEAQARGLQEERDAQDMQRFAATLGSKSAARKVAPALPSAPSCRWLRGVCSRSQERARALIGG